MKKIPVKRFQILFRALHECRLKVLEETIDILCAFEEKDHARISAHSDWQIREIERLEDMFRKEYIEQHEDSRTI